MREYWAGIWRSSTRATIAGAILSAVVASVLYAFNWHTFYDTRSNNEDLRAEIVAKDIANLAEATHASPGHDKAFKTALTTYLEPRRQNITVSRSLPGDKQNSWVINNDVDIDETRSLVASEFILDAGEGDRASLKLSIQVGVRPRLVVALARAWTFSAADYIRDPQYWHKAHLINRSIPLYGYLLTIIIVGFGTIKTMYRDQQELLRLEKEGQELEGELDTLRAVHKEAVDELQRQVQHSGGQLSDALDHRDKLSTTIKRIDEEYRKLIDTSPAGDQKEQRLMETGHKRSQAEHALASYNLKVDHFESELEKTKAELQAAEHLLHEVDDRREGLHTKLQDRNKEIRKLRSLIKETQKEVRHSQSTQLRLDSIHMREVKSWEKSHVFIEQQLEQWVKTGAHARINFASHGMANAVERQFQKIDQDFVHRYFSHVNNREYDIRTRRTIRVVTRGKQEPGTGGDLLVVLDDEAGRTIGMRYEIRKDAPDPELVGFVLAMLLRSKCKDFHQFSIRLR